MIFGKMRRLHFVGIGGAGMSGMAEVLADIGYTITGSDIARSEVTDHLTQAGIQVAVGHCAANVGDAHAVVISSAVSPDNPEVREANQRGIPVIKRAEMLGELMRLKFSIGIAGCHGKTTTTALIGHILKEANADPTVIVGGRLTDASIGAKIGLGEHMVVEADEFDRSFLVMYPSIAVVTNIDTDHLDCYKDLADLQDAFVAYVNRTPFYGQVIVNMDDPHTRAILPRVRRTVVSYGVSADADYQARDIRVGAGHGEFTLMRRGAPVATIRMPAPGMHNVMNALCAAAVACELDIPAPELSNAIARFPGVLRRFQKQCEVGGRIVFDDYAHHPTEVAAALKAARAYDRMVIAIFQPHLFSRTRDFASGFGEALGLADRAILVDIYPAREQPIPGVTSELIVSNAPAAIRHKFRCVGALNNAVSAVLSELPENALILTLGAGDVYKLCGAICAKLSGREGVHAPTRN